MKDKIKAKIIEHFSPHLNILAGAFIGSRSLGVEIFCSKSDYDCFLLIDGLQGHGSEIIVEHVSVHVVLIPQRTIEKYLQFDLIRCSWQFLTVLDWLRTGEIFYDPSGLLYRYKHEATEWFSNNIKNFISTKLSEIEILLSKLPVAGFINDYLENNFIALYMAMESILTYLLFKGKVFHGPKRCIHDLRIVDQQIYKSFANSLNLTSIDIESLCDITRKISEEIKNGLHIVG